MCAMRVSTPTKELEEVKVWRMLPNRADSGAPHYVPHYFWTKSTAARQREIYVCKNEEPEEVTVLHDPETHEYFIEENGIRSRIDIRDS